MHLRLCFKASALPKAANVFLHFNAYKMKCVWVSACVSEWGPQSSWRPLAVGSSPNMTELSLLTQGDWAEGATAHNGGTMAAPLVLMGDTCNRIRVRTRGGRPHGEMVHPHPSPLTTTPPQTTPPCPVPLHQTCTNPQVMCRTIFVWHWCLTFFSTLVSTENYATILKFI